MAFYQHGELLRLLGDIGGAEDAYREASRHRVRSAAGACTRPPRAGARRRRRRRDPSRPRRGTRTADDPDQRPGRTRVLPAAVVIRLAAGDVEGAAEAATALAAAAAETDVPFLHATSAHMSGAVAVEAGAAREGLEHLRRAHQLWTDLDAPYEVARVRVLIGRALRDLGDDDGAALELDAAATTFRRLGAAPDLAQVEALTTAHPRGAGPLTGRELEVLALVAAGRSNREIAGDLVISERTVARHVANIFTKLDVSSRAAATAHGSEAPPHLTPSPARSWH